MKNLVRISNIVAIVSIVLLTYWVFVFIVVEVFGLKVFRENLSQTFGLSVMGILALMAGSLMINVMFNMTRIADSKDSEADPSKAGKASIKRVGIGLLAVFPLLVGLMFGGDYLTSRKKESVLINAATKVIESNPKRIKAIVDYRFSEEWMAEAGELVERMKKTDENFPFVQILAMDRASGVNDVLQFGNYSAPRETDKARKRIDFMFSTSVEERRYLESVFKDGNVKHRFSASDGNYELYYPYFDGEKRIVIYFSDFQRYGKLGS